MSNTIEIAVADCSCGCGIQLVATKVTNDIILKIQDQHQLDLASIRLTPTEIESLIYLLKKYYASE